MTLEELEAILWTLQDAQISEDVTFGPAVGVWSKRREESMRVIRREIKRCKAEQRNDLKEIKSQLGYSRIGRNNV